jgi:plastocyanin
VGDIVRFIFQQKNHTVTQSSFDNPCQPISNGFDTNFVPVPDSQTNDFPVAELQVSRTTPVWAYCRQGNHCTQGMVFAINPGDKFAEFLAKATGAASPAATTSAAVTIQPVPTSASTGASPTSTSRDHKVVVGGPGVLVFNPANITAQPGDTITFEFHQKNHTVTASSFDAPCRDLASSTGQIGFDSAFQPVTDGAATFPTYTVQVNDTKPIWAFCKQGNHCGQGMVFAANAVESGPKNFAAFQSLAKQLNGTGSSTQTPPYGGDARSVIASVYPSVAIAAVSLVTLMFL